jgi:phosphoserine aminotransferase
MEKLLMKDTGTWASGAIKEAKPFEKPVVASKDSNYTFIPKRLYLIPNANYFHCTSKQYNLWNSNEIISRNECSCSL